VRAGHQVASPPPAENEMGMPPDVLPWPAGPGALDDRAPLLPYRRARIGGCGPGGPGGGTGAPLS
jgi:hypothetical protein